MEVAARESRIPYLPAKPASGVPKVEAVTLTACRCLRYVSRIATRMVQPMTPIQVRAVLRVATTTLTDYAEMVYFVGKHQLTCDKQVTYTLAKHIRCVCICGEERWL